MRAWFTSLNGLVTLSALSLLSFIGYMLMEMRYYLGKWIPGEGAAMAETIAAMLIVGGWLRSLFVAANGGRGGRTALLVFSGFTTLVALYDMQYVFSTAMPWPEETMIFVMLGTAVLAIAALWAQRRQRQTAR